MVAGLGFFCDPDDFAVLDQEGLAAADREAHHAGDSECLGDFAVLVGDQGEGEFKFFFKLLLRFNGIAADAEDLKVLTAEGGKRIAEGAGLSGAAGGFGFWVEKDQSDAFGVNIGEGDGLPALVSGGDLRRGCADFERGEFFSKSEKGQHGNYQYGCTKHRRRTIVVIRRTANFDFLVRTRTLFLVALAAALAASSGVWFATEATLQAAGQGAAAWAGLIGAPWGDRLVALAWGIGGWIGATAVRSAMAFGIWLVMLGGVLLVIRRVAASLRRERAGAVVCWVLAVATFGLGAWEGFAGWKNNPRDARLFAPVDLIALAQKNGGRVFVNPSATFDVAALAPGILGERPLKDRAAMMASPVRWREEDREIPSSGVLIAGSVPEARPLIEHLLASPDWRLAFVDNGGILFLHGNGPNFSPRPPAEIVAGFERAQHGYVLARTALNYHESGLKIEARSLMSEAVKSAPDDARVLTCAASLAASQGRWERARTDAEKALKLDPDSQQASYLFALSLLETGAPQRAHTLASELVGRAPRDASILLLHARTSRAANDPTSEIASLEKLLALAEGSSLSRARVQIYLGQAWAKRGFPDQALAAYRAAVQGGLSSGEESDVREAIKTIEDNRLPVEQ